MIDTVTRMLAPLRARVANLVARAVVQLVSDAQGLQVVQLGVLADETRDGLERFQEYGFSSVPFAGAEAVVLFVGGRRDHGLVVAVDDRRYRKRNLEPGESAIYTDEGDYVVLKRGRIVEVKAGTKLRVDAPLAEITGNVTIAGTLDVTGAVTARATVAVTAGVTAASVAASGAVSDGAGSMDSMRGTYNSHTHPENGTGGGTTSPPNQGM